MGGGSASAVALTPAGERLYNPYEGLAAAVDGRGLRGTYKLPAQVRNWGEGGVGSAGRRERRRKRALARRDAIRARGVLPAPPDLGACLALTRCVCVRVFSGGWGTEPRATMAHPKHTHTHHLPPLQPEFLFAEEATVHRRSWSENLTYYTGAGYLVGAAVGGTRGAAAALRSPAPAAATASAGGAAAAASAPPPTSARLLVNRVLNSGGRAGRGAANALGALGLFFAVAESGLDAAADGRGPDAAPTIGAGFVTGALFRSPRGPRAAGVAGGVGAVAAAALVAARRHVSSDL